MRTRGLKLKRILPLALALLMAVGCDERSQDALDFGFEIPRTESFPTSLSSHGLFKQPMSDLNPSEGTHLYELSSQLFTDYAGKQRLMRLPAGEAVTLDGGVPTYPDGTTLVKTFYFDNDLRDPARGRDVVETRLLIKAGGLWNVATYLWNEDQTDAVLSLDGSTAGVSWLDENGDPRSTDHEVPSEVACVTCHQRDEMAEPIGPTLRNLDRLVERDGQTTRQLEHLQSLGLLPPAIPDVPAMVDYRDESQSLDARARSYLDVNCAHCHNPAAWVRSARQGLDLRYDVELSQTGILESTRPLREQLRTGAMPFIGTTLVHDEGVDLITDYLDSL